VKNRTHKLFIEDMLEAMTKIERYIKAMDYNAFSQNTLVIDAVVRNLEVIGEAATNIPENIRDSYLNIPWRRMVGLRNIVIHEYFGIDLKIIWEIVSRNLPETKPGLIAMLNDLE